MADVKWIKITTDIFDDEKILLIESLPDCYAIITVWFKLLCLAGKQNNSGIFMMNNQIPYTEKMLATIFRMNEATVTLALQTFEQFGMVEIIDGVITIPNWGKHQNLDQLESKKQYMKKYMKEYREKQKALIGGNPNSKFNGKVNSKVNSKVNVSKADKEVIRLQAERDFYYKTLVSQQNTQSETALNYGAFQEARQTAIMKHIQSDNIRLEKLLEDVESVIDDIGRSLHRERGLKYDNPELLK